MSVGDAIELRTTALATRDSPGMERRDPTAATQQLTYMGTNNPMVPDWDARTAVEFGYKANVIAYRCIQIKARTAASLPIRCGPDPLDPTRFNVNSPLARLLGPPPGGPAPKLAARKLIAWSFAQLDTTGRFAWELELGPSGAPDYFWPLVSADLKAIPSDSGSEWFRAFTYGRASAPKHLTPDRVFYDWTPSQSDFRQPESPLQASRYDLSIATMGDRYSYGFLKNGAVPAAVVITQRPPDQASQDRFEQRWSADYQGPDNAGRVRHQYVDDIPEDGDVGKMIDVKVLGLPQKDARFIEQHRASLEMIAIGLGVPWSKLDASGRTFDNAGHEDRTFWVDTILPMLHDFEDQINLELAPRLGTDLMWFDTSSIEALRQPEDFTVADGLAMYDRQLIEGDDVRRVARLAPVGKGFAPDVMPDTNLPPAPKPDPVLGPGGQGKLEQQKPEKREPTPEEQRQVEEDRAAAVELRRSLIWRKSDAQVRSLERRWERSMRRLFKKQARSVEGSLRGKRGHKLFIRAPGDEGIDATSLFNPAYWQDQTVDVTDDLYEAVTAQGFAGVSTTFGVDFDLEQPYAQDFIQARANTLAGQVTDTTYQQIQDALAAAVENGDDIDTISATLADIFDTAGTSRAVTIARTEVISAFNGSASLAVAQLPADVVGGQEWISARDGRTRDSHAQADGQVVGIGEAFNVGGAQLAYPGDPAGPADEVVNCRCTAAYLTPDEMDPSRSKPRTVPLAAARMALRLVRPGDFDEPEFRSALEETA